MIFKILTKSQIRTILKTDSQIVKYYKRLQERAALATGTSLGYIQRIKLNLHGKNSYVQHMHKNKQYQANWFY